MKPETARKHFADPFRYCHPVTNNVQKLKVLLVAPLVESLFLAKVRHGVFFSNATVASLFCFSPRFFLILIYFFYFAIETP